MATMADGKNALAADKLKTFKIDFSREKKSDIFEFSQTHDELCKCSCCEFQSFASDQFGVWSPSGGSALSYSNNIQY